MIKAEEALKALEEYGIKSSCYIPLEKFNDDLVDYLSKRSKILGEFIEKHLKPTFDELKQEVESLHLDLRIQHDGSCLNIFKNNMRVIEVMKHKVTFIEPFEKVGKPLWDFINLTIRYLEGQKEIKNETTK